MTLEETRKLILEDDEFVMQETLRLRYLYRLKREIRYAQVRHEEIYTESVAEHLYGMCVLSNYFLPLEDAINISERSKIYDMITWHDADEIETGDILGQLKTDTDRQNERDAMKVVLEKAPSLLSSGISLVISEYEARQTFEAKFVRAIDKVEPLFEVLDDNYKEVFRRNETTRKQSDGIKQPYVQNFPYIKRFTDVISDHLDAKGFFVAEK